MTTPTTPQAWLGYAGMHQSGKAIVRICCACPDKAQADAEAASAGQLVTHTYCVSCYQAELAALLGERQN